MKRVKQIKESKDMIKEALFRLLEKKELDKITMSEIAEEAGVVRMTLYRHFKEKEDIFLYCFENNVDKVLEEINRMDSPSLEDLLILRFRILKESPYTNILTTYGKYDKLTQTVGIKFFPKFEPLLPELKDAYLRSFIMGGLDAMTRQWIESQMKTSYRDMAQKVIKIINKLI